jgi:hypothetical protein
MSARTDSFAWACAGRDGHCPGPSLTEPPRRGCKRQRRRASTAFRSTRDRRGQELKDAPGHAASPFSSLSLVRGAPRHLARTEMTPRTTSSVHPSERSRRCCDAVLWMSCIRVTQYRRAATFCLRSTVRVLDWAVRARCALASISRRYHCKCSGTARGVVSVPTSDCAPTRRAGVLRRYASRRVDRRRLEILEPCADALPRTGADADA